MYLIYALIDPTNYEIRYIGLTGTGSRRFMQHLDKAGKNHRKNGWIQELEDKGEVVIFEVLDKASSLDLARQKEAFWIERYRRKKIPLLNRYIPPSVLPDMTRFTPAQIQLFSSLEELEYVFVRLQEKIEYWCGTVRGECAAHPSVQMASHHFYIGHTDAITYFVQKWAKTAFHDHAVLGYRFKLFNGEWAPFGDSEAIERCEGAEMRWVLTSKRWETECSPILVPLCDDSGNILYSEKGRGARFLRDCV